MRVAAAFVNTTPLDWEANRRECAQALELAREEGAQLLLLPELCLSGYGCEDAFFSADLRRRALTSLEAMLPRTRGLIAAFGLPFEHESRLYNAMALCADGRLVAIVPKQHLASDGIHYEPRWFSPWQLERRETVRLFGGEVPLGDWIVRAGEAMIGFEICQDAWVDSRPCRNLKIRGANLILCPSASHFALGKQAGREALVMEAAKQGLGYAYANLMGNEAGRAIYDGGAMLADASGMLARGRRFSYRGAGLVCADLSLKKPGKGEGVADSGWEPSPAQKPLKPAPAEAALDAFAEFRQAVALGLFDYLRKSKAKGFVISLSGGADSAACAVLVDSMRQAGLAELGEAAFAQRLGHADPLLTCVYQATGNSGSVTREAARGLALGLKAPFLEFEIEPLVAQYKAMVEKGLGRELSWDKDDLTLQNLQARVRSPGVWALANARGALLLATNNRSEAAAGYTSMDGDTSGGLAPIAGIGKHFLRAWLRSLEAEYPALKAVNVQLPTAELRPPAQKQTDEQDLMPYEVLDTIERLAARDHLAPGEVFAEAGKLLPGHSAADLGGWVTAYFGLWARSQWKRERLAPSFHLDDHNLDPRSWRRFPILSGGYVAEIAELRASLGL